MDEEVSDEDGEESGEEEEESDAEEAGAFPKFFLGFAILSCSFSLGVFVSSFFLSEFSSQPSTSEFVNFG